MLKKMVNGIEVICSSEEEASIRARWAENEAIEAERQKKMIERRSLLDKLGDIPEFLDKLCKKLNLDPSQKDSW